MQERGNRIYYNQLGKVLWMTGETKIIGGELDPHLENEIVNYIEIPYGDETLKDALKYHVDTELGELVVDEYVVYELTAEQKRIIELENQLLLVEGVI